jgi:hypothetical protein
MSNFDQLCAKFLKEANNPGTNPTSAESQTTPGTPSVGGGATKPATPSQSQPPSSTPQPTQTPQGPQQQLHPDDILKNLTQLKDHPEFAKVIGVALDQLSKNQQQKQFVNQQSNNANSTSY